MKKLLFLLLLVSLPTHANEFNFGLGRSNYDVHGKGDEWVPMNGSFTERDDQHVGFTLRGGYTFSLFSVPMETSMLYISPITETMHGYNSNNQIDNRQTKTQTIGIDLSIRPKLGIFYIKGGIFAYYARSEMEAQLGNEHYTITRNVTDTSGEYGLGIEFKTWRVEWLHYNNMYVRQSDLGGYNAREEFRNLNTFSVIKSF